MPLKRKQQELMTWLHSCIGGLRLTSTFRYDPLEFDVHDFCDDFLRHGIKMCLLLQLENYHEELEEMKNMSRQEYVAHLRR